MLCGGSGDWRICFWQKAMTGGVRHIWRECFHGVSQFFYHFTHYSDDDSGNDSEASSGSCGSIADSRGSGPAAASRGDPSSSSVSASAGSHTNISATTAGDSVSLKNRLKGKSDAAKKVTDFFPFVTSDYHFCCFVFLSPLMLVSCRSQALKGFFSELKAEILVLDSWTLGLLVLLFDWTNNSLRFRAARLAQHALRSMQHASRKREK